MSEPKSELHAFHLALLIFGGLCAGFGVVNLYYSFGWAGGDLNSNHALVGFSGLDNIGLLPSSSLAIPAVVIGALCMIIANATAWKETDGY